MTVPRVRFAPSPTGALHLGGARTALFNWLYARHTGGALILRIEDTDKERSTDANTQVILDGLRWLGIDWDEGPFFQGANSARHRADAIRLLKEGKAYKDYLTGDELSEARADAQAVGDTFRYDRDRMALPTAELERRIAADAPYTIRFRIPDEELAWDDAVRGRIAWQGHDLDDFIVLRSDGSAVYNLAVVSDDAEMRVSHVIRGDDHISNTPKQLALYRALGYPVPIFAHVPMLLGSDGKKLSKRHGATAVGDYRGLGIVPAAMRNYLALLGWSPGDDDELLDPAELVSRFTLEAIQNRPATFDPVKLEWMNGRYLSSVPAIELLDQVLERLKELGHTPKPDAALEIIAAVKSRCRTVLTVADAVALRLPEAIIKPTSKGEALAERLGERFAANIKLARETLGAIPEEGWKSADLETDLKALALARGLKLGDLMQPIRVALTGTTVSEPVHELLEIVGRDESFKRLDECSLARKQSD